MWWKWFAVTAVEWQLKAGFFWFFYVNNMTANVEIYSVNYELEGRQCILRTQLWVTVSLSVTQRVMITGYSNQACVLWIHEHYFFGSAQALFYCILRQYKTWPSAVCCVSICSILTSTSVVIGGDETCSASVSKACYICTSSVVDFLNSLQRLTGFSWLTHISLMFG